MALPVTGPPDYTRQMWLARLRDFFLNAHVTQAFGPSSLSVEPSYMGYTDFHEGVDLVFPGGHSVGPTYSECLGSMTHGGIGQGAPVYAPTSGRVTHAGDAGDGYGNSVTILAPNGFTFQLGHFDSLYTSEDRNGNPVPGPTLHTGDLVYAGQLIAQQGTSGCSTGPHVHFGVKDPTGQWIDPGGLAGEGGNNILYTLGHDLGWGAGYNPGHTVITMSPDPLTASLPPVPYTSVSFRDRVWHVLQNNALAKTDLRFPFRLGGTVVAENGNFDPATYQDPNTDPTTGEPYPVTVSNVGENSGFDAFGAAGNLLGLLFGSGNDAGIQQQREQLALTGQQWMRGCMLLVGGAVLLVIGLHALTREKPVQVITQPIADTGKAVGDTAKKAAEVAAVA